MTLRSIKQLQASNTMFFNTLFWIPSVNYSTNQCATKQIPQIYRGCNCYIRLHYIYFKTLLCNMLRSSCQYSVSQPFDRSEYWTEQQWKWDNSLRFKKITNEHKSTYRCFDPVDVLMEVANNGCWECSCFLRKIKT